MFTFLEVPVRTFLPHNPLVASKCDFLGQFFPLTDSGPGSIVATSISLSLCSIAYLPVPSSAILPARPRRLPWVVSDLSSGCPLGFQGQTCSCGTSLLHSPTSHSLAYSSFWGHEGLILILGCFIETWVSFSISYQSQSSSPSPYTLPQRHIQAAATPQLWQFCLWVSLSSANTWYHHSLSWNDLFSWQTPITILRWGVVLRWCSMMSTMIRSLEDLFWCWSLLSPQAG